MKKQISFGLGLGCLLAFAGCGNGNSNTPAPAIPVETFAQSQEGLPATGYWLCREDFISDYNAGTPVNDAYVAVGEGRSDTKRKVAENCMNGMDDRKCSDGIHRNQIQCARADSIGGLDGRSENTVCRVEFPTKSGGNDAFEASEDSQLKAAKRVFDSCVNSVDQDACTNAILLGAMTCTPLN